MNIFHHIWAKVSSNGRNSTTLHHTHLKVQLTSFLQTSTQSFHPYSINRTNPHQSTAVQNSDFSTIPNQPINASRTGLPIALTSKFNLRKPCGGLHQAGCESVLVTEEKAISSPFLVIQDIE